MGRHDGIHRFTVGQRRGLGLATGKPVYVVAVDKKNQRVVVGNDEELHHREALARDVNWVSIAPPTEPVRAMVRIRNNHEPAAATVTPAGDSDAAKVQIVFDEPQRAVTPGQGVVFYAAADSPEPDLLLGGGWITEARG